TLAVAAALQARGFDIRGIRPPTVPEGTSRLRISLTLHVDENEISAMVEALVEVLASP
ncbi:MAG: 8-amino-7-oxononanoate synthase, partial [Mesorhizobium sp.]